MKLTLKNHYSTVVIVCNHIRFSDNDLIVDGEHKGYLDSNEIFLLGTDAYYHDVTIEEGKCEA